MWIRPEHPVPLSVDLQMLPDDMGHVPANDQVEGVVGIGQLAEIPLPELRRHAEGRGVFPGVKEHSFRSVDPDNAVACPGEQHREEAGTAAGVQNPQRPVGWGVCFDEPQPFCGSVGFEFIHNVVVEIVGQFAPMLVDLFLQSHCFSYRSIHCQ